MFTTQDVVDAGRSHEKLADQCICFRGGAMLTKRSLLTITFALGLVSSSQGRTRARAICLRRKREWGCTLNGGGSSAATNGVACGIDNAAGGDPSGGHAATSNKASGDVSLAMGGSNEATGDQLSGRRCEQSSGLWIPVGGDGDRQQATDKEAIAVGGGNSAAISASRWAWNTAGVGSTAIGDFNSATNGGVAVGDENLANAPAVP